MVNIIHTIGGSHNWKLFRFGNWEIERWHVKFALLVFTWPLGSSNRRGSWEEFASELIVLLSQELEISYSAPNSILKSIIAFTNLTFQLWRDFPCCHIILYFLPGIWIKTEFLTSLHSRKVESSGWKQVHRDLPQHIKTRCMWRHQRPLFSWTSKHIDSTCLCADQNTPLISSRSSHLVHQQHTAWEHYPQEGKEFQSLAPNLPKNFIRLTSFRPLENYW